MILSKERSKIGLQCGYNEPGSAPGILVDKPFDRSDKNRITLVRYSDQDYQQQVVGSLDECWKEDLKDALTWINIEGNYDAALLESLGDKLGLHRLSLEDVLNAGHRPKWESYGDYYYLIMNLFDAGRPIKSCQVNIFLGPNYVLTLEEFENGVFDPIRERLRENIGLIRKMGSGFLCYSICDALVDQLFPLVEDLGDELDDLEDRLMEYADQKIPAEIHRLKRDLLLIGKIAWAEREVVNALQRGDLRMVSAETVFYLRDCYDHVVQIIDMIETLRDITTGLLDSYLSSVSNQTNSVMKVLTIIATVFIPLTFIVGVYGMNFNPGAGPLSMPELNMTYGYVTVWGIMILIVVGMFIAFRRNKWL